MASSLSRILDREKNIRSLISVYPHPHLALPLPDVHLHLCLAPDSILTHCIVSLLTKGSIEINSSSFLLESNFPSLFVVCLALRAVVVLVRILTVAVTL